MKKIFLVLSILFLACAYSFGQKYSFLEEDNYGDKSSLDGFFTTTYSEYREENLEWGVMPLLPRTHGYLYDYSAEPMEDDVPLGSGALILGLFGTAYLLKKKDSEI